MPVLYIAIAVTAGYNTVGFALIVWIYWLLLPTRDPAKIISFQ